jgi:hypothetical protein
MKSADQENRVSIDAAERSRISTTHYFPVTSFGFDSLGCILAILYIAMSTTRETIATLTAPFMAKALRKMMTTAAPKTQIMEMMICICESLFLRMGRNSEWLRQLKPLCPTP